MITYKLNILEALKAAGYTTYKLRKEKLIGEATIQQLREGRLVSWASMTTLCRLLDCQPGDLLQYVSDELEEYVTPARSTVLKLDGEPTPNTYNID